MDDPVASGGTLEGYPLSAQQERLLALAETCPLPPTRLALHLDGPLDRPALDAALTHVMALHEVLRTTVARPDGAGPGLQVIGDPVPVHVRPAQEGQEGQDPALLRTDALVATCRSHAPDHHDLDIRVPTLGADTTSALVLARDLVDAYSRCVGRQSTPVLPTPVQHSQFAHWQRQLLVDRASSTLVADQRRRAELPRPHLPQRRMLPPGPPGPPEWVEQTLLPPERARLREVSGTVGLPEDFVLLTLWAGLLARLSGRTDAAVCIELACRNHAALLDTVGPCSKWVSIQPSILDATSWVAAAHGVEQSLAVVPGVADHWPVTGPDGQPGPADTACTCTTLPAAWSVGDLSVQVQDVLVDADGAGVRLDCVLGEVDARLRLRTLSHDLPAAAAAELLTGFRALLRGALAQPSVPLDQLSSPTPSRAPTPAPTPAEPARPNSTPPPGRPPAGAPLDDLERCVARHMEDVLGRPVRDRDDAFFALGGHSMSAVRLVTRLSAELGRPVPLTTLFATADRPGQPPADSVRAVAASLRGAVEGPDALAVLRAGGDLPAVWCLPAAGADPTDLRHLAAALPPGRPVFGVRVEPAVQEPAPGEQPGDEVSVESLAEVCARRLLAAHQNGPWHLVGWSLGGLVALEVARRLAHVGPVTLVLVDSFLHDRATPDLDLPRAPDGVPSELSRPERAELERRLEDYRRVAGAACRYLPDRYDGPASLVQAASQAPATRARSAARWSSVLPALQVSVLPGDHLTIVADPHVRALAAVVDAVAHAGDARVGPARA